MTTSAIVIDKTWNGDPLPVEQQIRLSLRYEEDGLHLDVDAPFYDDPAPAQPVGSVDGLWNYEVVELFIASLFIASAGNPAHLGETAYLEIELGPHGHYLALQLSDIRQIEVSGLPLDFTAQIDRNAGRWSGHARIPATYLPPLPHRVNAYAIHGQGDARRYLSWQPLPGDEPDFHQPDRFAPVPPPGL